jgi:YesN/AraC family two-component response regulator
VVIETSVENKTWEVQVQEVAESETNILSVIDEKINVAILQVKDTPNFWDFIERLRSIYNNMEIILVSQEPDFNLAYQAIQHRISHFLLEPVEKDNFIRIFSELEEKQHILENEKEKEQILMSYEHMESELSSSEFVTQMKPFLQDMQSLMKEEENKEWAVGIGPIVDDVREVQKSADWAIFALHNWNLNRVEHLFTSLDSKGQLEDKSILDQVKRKKLQKFLRQLQLVELEQLLEEDMEKCNMAGNPYDTQRMVREILQLTKEIWSNQIGRKVLEELLSKELFPFIFNSQKKIRTLLRILDELEDLGKERIQISPNYFSNLFREETGVNYLDYLTEYRLSQSKILLKETDWTIEHISKEIGYQDVKYYSQLFKKYYDITPGKYRKTEG